MLFFVLSFCARIVRKEKRRKREKTTSKYYNFNRISIINTGGSLSLSLERERVAI
jgi:hypothetical protein